MDMTDPTQWMRWISRIGAYLYRNIELPRVSSEYQSQPIVRVPTREEIVVGMWEILSSVHPNYYALAIMAVCLVLFMYIKLRYPFWNTQPVVHTYDYYRKWFIATPGILQKYPYKTRFYDKTKQIQTHDISRISAEEMKLICEFLQSNYIITDRLLSEITEKTIRPHFQGHNAPSYMSIHRELDGTITAVSTSQMRNMFMFWGGEAAMANPENRESMPNHIELYMLDYVCFKRDYPANAQLAERMIQTHEYNIRIMNPTISASLFKKEGGRCEGVVPFVEYTTYTFYMRNLAVSALPPHYTITRVEKENVDLLHDIYHILTTPEHGAGKFFSVCVLPDIANVIGRLASRQLYLFCLKKGGHLYGAYLFKDANIHYEDLEGKTLALVASIQNTNHADLFMAGFMHSLRHILKETSYYKMLTIDTLGHNSIILGKWMELHHTILEMPDALYLYNYVYPRMPIHPAAVFAL
jgi:hypothetical protein